MDGDYSQRPQTVGEAPRPSTSGAESWWKNSGKGNGSPTVPNSKKIQESHTSIGFPDIRQENRPSKRQTEVRPYVDETLKGARKLNRQELIQQLVANEMAGAGVPEGVINNALGTAAVHTFAMRPTTGSAVRLVPKPGTRMIKQPAGNPDDRPQTAPNKVSGFQPPPSRSMVKALASMILDPPVKGQRILDVIKPDRPRGKSLMKQGAAPVRTEAAEEQAVEALSGDETIAEEATRPPSPARRLPPILAPVSALRSVSPVEGVWDDRRSRRSQQQPAPGELLASLRDPQFRHEPAALHRDTGEHDRLHRLRANRLLSAGARKLAQPLPLPPSIAPGVLAMESAAQPMKPNDLLMASGWVERMFTPPADVSNARSVHAPRPGAGGGRARPGTAAAALGGANASSAAAPAATGAGPGASFALAPPPPSASSLIRPGTTPHLGVTTVRPGTVFEHSQPGQPPNHLTYQQRVWMMAPAETFSRKNGGLLMDGSLRAHLQATDNTKLLGEAAALLHRNAVSATAGGAVSRRVRLLSAPGSAPEEHLLDFAAARMHRQHAEAMLPIVAPAAPRLIVKLDISNNPLDEQLADSLFEVLMFGTQIRTLVAKSCALNDSLLWRIARVLDPVITARGTRLRELDVSGNAAVGDRGAALLFDAVASNGFLESLGVAACGLGEAAFVKAAEMMGRNAGLRRLSLAGNRGASAKAMHALGEALKESPIEELSLAETGLRLEGMEALAAALAASPALTSLDVSRNGLVGGSFDPLTPVLPRNTTLRVLTLQGNPIGMPAAVSLLEAWRAGGFRGTLDMGECVLSVITVAVDEDALAAAAAASGKAGKGKKGAAKGGKKDAKGGKKDESPKKGAKKGAKAKGGKKGAKKGGGKEDPEAPPASAAGPGLIATEVPPVAPLGTPPPTDAEFETLWKGSKIKGASMTDSWIVDYIRLLCTSMSFTVQQATRMVRSLEWGANQVEAAALLLQQMPEDAHYWDLGAGAGMLPKDWRLALSLANRPTEPPGKNETVQLAQQLSMQQQHEEEAAAGEGEGKEEPAAGKVPAAC